MVYLVELNYFSVSCNLSYCESRMLYFLKRSILMCICALGDFVPLQGPFTCLSQHLRSSCLALLGLRDYFQREAAEVLVTLVFVRNMIDALSLFLVSLLVYIQNM